MSADLSAFALLVMGFFLIGLGFSPIMVDCFGSAERHQRISQGVVLIGLATVAVVTAIKVIG